MNSNFDAELALFAKRVRFPLLPRLTRRPRLAIGVCSRRRCSLWLRGWCLARCSSSSPLCARRCLGSLRFRLGSRLSARLSARASPCRRASRSLASWEAFGGGSDSPGAGRVLYWANKIPVAVGRLLVEVATRAPLATRLSSPRTKATAATKTKMSRHNRQPSLHALFARGKQTARKNAPPTARSQRRPHLLGRLPGRSAPGTRPNCQSGARHHFRRVELACRRRRHAWPAAGSALGRRGCAGVCSRSCSRLSLQLSALLLRSLSRALSLPTNSSDPRMRLIMQICAKFVRLTRRLQFERLPCRRDGLT